jgi:hypothetical protein
VWRLIAKYRGLKMERGAREVGLARPVSRSAPAEQRKGRGRGRKGKRRQEKEKRGEELGCRGSERNGPVGRWAESEKVRFSLFFFSFKTLFKFKSFSTQNHSKLFKLFTKFCIPLTPHTSNQKPCIAK